MRITTSQYKAIKNKNKISKEDMQKLAKWEEPEESEDMIQMEIVSRLQELESLGKVIKYTSIPNETYTPYKSVRSRRMRMGLRKWLCDLFVIYKDFYGNKKLLFLELKTTKNRATDDQKAWIEALTGIENVTVKLAKWIHEARAVLIEIFAKY